jgi:hypothetical protein
VSQTAEFWRVPLAAKATSARTTTAPTTITRVRISSEKLDTLRVAVYAEINLDEMHTLLCGAVLRTFWNPHLANVDVINEVEPTRSPARRSQAKAEGSPTALASPARQPGFYGPFMSPDSQFPWFPSVRCRRRYARSLSKMGRYAVRYLRKVALLRRPGG